MGFFVKLQVGLWSKVWRSYLGAYPLPPRLGGLGSMVPYIMRKRVRIPDSGSMENTHGLDSKGLGA